MGFTKLVKKDKAGQVAAKKKPVTKEEQVVNYIVDHKATTRQAAAEFEVSHMTVQRYVQKMATSNKKLFTEARKVLNKNAEESTLRGGMKTSEKYKEIRGEAEEE
jgi:putative DeoR family transcriptional regulator (stage III sporulation protein D)